jgi:ribose transport system ATP-binding protein
MSPLLEACHLHKRFLGVQALQDVSASFFPGQVTAVMGENGAGKSTLMKALAGVHEPNEGEIRWLGERVSIPSVRAAAALGIAFIHQELNLAENLTAGANVFLGREPTRYGFVATTEIRRRTQALFDQLGLPFSPDTPVGDLSLGHQQMVEIAKALSQQAKLLIMDEPTSSLSARESDRLFAVVRELRERGLGIVFISHRMSEVQDLADRVIVLRDGKNSGVLERGEITRDRIVNLMVGRDLDLPDKVANTAGRTVLKVNGLRTQRFPLLDVNFTLGAGEIVGVAGLVGAGRTEVARSLFGIDPALGGTVEVGGVVHTVRTPGDAIAAGIAFVPEDRKAQGVLLDLSIRDNIALPALSQFQTAGWAHDGAITQMAETHRTRLSIKTPTVHKEVGQLSGGNQQKVAIAKWLTLKPKVFLLDEPTRGVDVGAKSEIYAVIEQMAAAGAGVLLISSDLEEILRISDRVLVMHEGRIAGELPRAGLNEKAIMHLATGGE